jgi:YidC/Oxa1 family membrane protein insertase
MKNENARNTIIFIVCTVAILIVYQVFVMQPQMEARRKAAALRAAQAPAASTQTGVPGAVPDALPGQPGAVAPNQVVALPRAAALAESPRVAVTTPSLTGSIALKGGQIDDLHLTKYRETVAKNAPLVEMLTPSHAEHGYYAEFGWLGADARKFPGPDAQWRQLTPGSLTPTTPLDFAYDSPEGLSFRRRIAVDDKYMFTVSDAVTNNSGHPVQLSPYALVQRNGLPADIDKSAFNVHQGALRALGEGNKFETNNYKDWKKKVLIKDSGKGGWLGITDKYWMAAIVPDQTKTGLGRLQVGPGASGDIYTASYTGDGVAVAPGAVAQNATRLFAGAKEAEALKAYEKRFAIPKFYNAIDWGWLYILTQPMFLLLHFFFTHVGNFGIAILLLTMVVRGLLFPLANQTFASGAKMKKLQPKIDELKKKFANDATKQQQEMMELWKREKINPVAGCLPVLIQIPVFIALVKLLSATLEMRHAPFMGWIKDLSARDPTTIWNLFGLLPYNPSDFDMPWLGHIFDGNLHIGIVALVYMGMMYLQQAMTPMTADPTQQQIMKFMPLMFVFIMAIYPVGLMIYWIWSTVLSVGQQYWFMHRYKVDNPIDGLIARLTNGGKDPSDIDKAPG